jgi:hypothetical protein
MTSKFNQMESTDKEEVRRATPLPIQKAKVIRTPSHPTENGYHQVYVKLYYDDSRQRAIVTMGKQGDVSIPEEGEDVFVLFGAADKPVVIDSFYPVDDEFGNKNENVPDYEPGDRIIGNSSGSHLAIRNDGTIEIVTDENQAVNIDRQSAIAHITTTQSIPGDDNYYVVEFDTEEDDKEDLFDPSTHDMTLKHGGAYDVDASVTFQTPGQNNRYTIAIYVNGQQEKRRSLQSSVNAEISPTISMERRLDAGDVVDIRIRHDGGGSRDLEGSKEASEFAIKRNGI